MSKKNFEGKFDRLISPREETPERAPKVSPNRTPEVTPKSKPVEAQKSIPKKTKAGKVTTLNEVFEGIKPKAEYQNTKIEKRIYDRFAEIAKENGSSFPGKLINRSLEWVLLQYENMQNEDDS